MLWEFLVWLWWVIWIFIYLCFNFALANGSHSLNIRSSYRYYTVTGFSGTVDSGEIVYVSLDLDHQIQVATITSHAILSICWEAARPQPQPTDNTQPLQHQIEGSNKLVRECLKQREGRKTSKIILCLCVRKIHYIHSTGREESIVWWISSDKELELIAVDKKY